jgi:shikimate kinase
VIITLVGYRGTGKTTVATHLAELLGWESVDADVALEAHVGRPIAEIFADDGEPAFRDYESAVLLELLQRKEHVIASGGGVILREANRDAIRKAGKVVWLTATPQTIFHRINGDATSPSRRPDLTYQGGLAEIESVLAKREPLYRQVADLIVDTEDRSPTSIANEIAKAIASGD